MVSFFCLPLRIPGENRPKLKKLFNSLLRNVVQWSDTLVSTTSVSDHFTTLRSKGLIWRVDWDGEHNTPDTQNTRFIFFISNCNNASNFWTEGNFCIISDCRNSFDYKLKNFISEQIIIFYSSLNAVCSFDKSVQIKSFKHHTFISMCSLFTWFNLQILNLC